MGFKYGKGAFSFHWRWALSGEDGSLGSHLGHLTVKRKACMRVKPTERKAETDMERD